MGTLFTHRYFRLSLAIAIATILFTAAVAKLVRPSPYFVFFYTALGIFELALALFLVVFSNRWQSWAVLSLIFASWLGYSCYTTIFGLPCSCLGAGLTLPRGTMFTVDAIVLASSWTLLFKEGQFVGSKRGSLCLYSAIAFIIGFAMPNVLVL